MKSGAASDRRKGTLQAACIRTRGVEAAVPSFELILPVDFSDYEWEVEVKGWFSAAIVVVAGKNYRLNFYDPTRLIQDVHADVQRDTVFFEPNLVVVESVTRANMTRAVERLVESGQVASLVEDGPCD